jgi:uncharacterized membrane protein YphA (DoxX/SURF4 family)
VPYIFLAGRILYGGFFALAGFDHFRRVALMVPYTASKGVPAPKLAILGSGALIMLAGLSIVLGYRPSWAVLLLTVFLLPVTFLMHNFWAASNPQVQQIDRVNFKKNVALLGAAWMLLAVPQPWPLSWP